MGEAVMKLMQANIVILTVLVLGTIAEPVPNKYLIETDDAPAKEGYESGVEGGAGGGDGGEDGGMGDDYCIGCGPCDFGCGNDRVTRTVQHVSLCLFGIFIWNILS